MHRKNALWDNSDAQWHFNSCFPCSNYSACGLLSSSLHSPWQTRPGWGRQGCHGSGNPSFGCFGAEGWLGVVPSRPPEHQAHTLWGKKQLKESFSIIHGLTWESGLINFKCDYTVTVCCSTKVYTFNYSPTSHLIKGPWSWDRVQWCPHKQQAGVILDIFFPLVFKGNVYCVLCKRESSYLVFTKLTILIFTFFPFILAGWCCTQGLTKPNLSEG